MSQSHNAPTATLRECPVCDESQLEVVPTPGHWTGASLFEPYRDRLGLTLCRACGFVFVNPRPTPEVLDRFYQGHEYVCHLPNHSASAGKVAHAQLALVDRLMPPRAGRGTFLDYGCGGGYLLRAALSRGWDAMGYDIAAPSMQHCRRQGLPVLESFEELRYRRFDR